LSEPQLYNQKIKGEIEKRFGSYEVPPTMQLTDNLYNKYGCWGQTTYLRETHTPIIIEVDKDLFDTSPTEGLTTVVHEMLEWRGIERKEPFPHLWAEQNQGAILNVASLTPLDYWLSQRPLLSLLVRGY